MKYLVVLLVLFCKTFSQGARTKVYLDARALSDDLIKQNVQFVDYVRDQHQADVIVFVRRESAANGGNYLIDFIGGSKFDNQKYSYSYFSSMVETDKKRNEEIIRKISLGLMPYILETDVANDLNVSFSSNTVNQVEEKRDDIDPWDSWVFEVGFDFSTRGEKTETTFDYGIDMQAERITEKLKTDISFYSNNSESEYVLTDTTQIYKNKRSNLNGRAVYSVFDKFSAGIFSSYRKSTYNNTKSAIEFMPAFEYSLFPYSESSKRFIRLIYKIGTRWNDYDELTIYNKTHEQLYQHRFSIRSRFTETWGSAYFNVNYSNYLHDFKLSNFNLNGYLNYKLIEGLSIRINGSYEKIKDQITLVKGDQTDEDILLNFKEKETNYRYRFSIGLSYSFGSIYNSVVNPRL